MYIGNVQILKEDGTKEVKGDAMLKSPVNRFDTFPAKSIVEAAVNDGESIVALEEYADRILQFKEQTLYIINISQDIEILEDVYKFKGVSQPSAVCKTDYGIAWANKLGCYLYDGKQVIDLLERGGRQILSEYDWQTLAARSPMIGYVPKKRQLIIVDDNTTAGDGRTFLYDMVTQSWVRGSGGGQTFTSHNLTNLVNDVNGDLVWSHTTGTMRKWDDTSDSGKSISFRTKDIDFGTPGQNKKIYKVLITYDSDGSNTDVQVYYDTDGGTAMDKTFANGTNFASNELDSADGWKIAELKPGTSSESNNKKSIQLRFEKSSAGPPAGFKINDISIVYRLKPVK